MLGADGDIPSGTLTTTLVGSNGIHHLRLVGPYSTVIGIPRTDGNSPQMRREVSEPVITPFIVRMTDVLLWDCSLCRGRSRNRRKKLDGEYERPAGSL